MKQSTENRYTKPLQEWKESQQRLTSVFSASILKSKAFEKEELAFREALLTRLGSPLNLEERITRKLLEQEKRELEKRLFPSRIVRLIRRAVMFSSQQLQPYFMPRQKDTKIPKRNEAFRSGRELKQLAASKAKRMSEKAPVVKQDFIGQEKFSENQQKNLLEGRSVEQKGRWFRLDLSDMDTKGRFALKEIPFRFDLEAKLEKLSIPLQPQAVAKLREGERIQVQIRSASGDQTVSVEANPIARSLNFYDEQQNKVTMKQVMGLQDTPTLSIGKQRKTGISVG